MLRQAAACADCAAAHVSEGTNSNVPLGFQLKLPSGAAKAAGSGPQKETTRQQAVAAALEPAGAGEQEGEDAEEEGRLKKQKLWSRIKDFEMEEEAEEDVWLSDSWSGMPHDMIMKRLLGSGGGWGSGTGGFGPASGAAAAPAGGGSGGFAGGSAGGGAGGPDAGGADPFPLATVCVPCSKQAEVVQR